MSEQHIEGKWCHICRKPSLSSRTEEGLCWIYYTSRKEGGYVAFFCKECFYQNCKPMQLEFVGSIYCSKCGFNIEETIPLDSHKHYTLNHMFCKSTIQYENRMCGLCYDHLINIPYEYNY